MLTPTLREFLLVNLCLLLYYALFRFVMRDETFFQWNRATLIGIALFSFVIPLVPWPSAEGVLPVLHLPEIQSNALSDPQATGPFSFAGISTGLWWGGVAFFFLHFLIALIRIVRLRFRLPSERRKGYRIIQVQADMPTFTFFNWVFWNNAWDKDNAGSVLAHELVHVKHGHTFDVLLLESLRMLFWYNPVTWWMARDAKALHEFIADREVIHAHANKREYADLLISRAFGSTGRPFTRSFFNPSLLKQRIMMMHQEKSCSAARFKYLLLLLLTGVLMVAASCTQIQGKRAATPEEVYTKADRMPEFVGGQDAMRQYLVQAIQYPKAAKDAGIEGMVYVNFIIEKNGAVNKAKVVKSEDDRLSAEALRVISSMPDWKPGKTNGKKVRVAFTIPIRFTLN